MANTEAGINPQASIPDAQQPNRERPTLSARTREISGQIKDLGKRINVEFKAIKGRIAGISEEEKKVALTEERVIQTEMSDLTTESIALIQPNHDTTPIIRTSDTTPVAAQKTSPSYPELTNERLEEIHKEMEKESMKQLEEKIMNSKAMEYPDGSLLDVLPSPAKIAESVDRYIAWRREHEENEGVREPGRARVLGHATSVEGAKRIILDGQLRSIKNLLCSDTPRVDLMQGGKARYIARSTEELVKADSALQQTVLEQRIKVLEYAPWLDAEKGALMQELQIITTIPDFVNIINNIVDEGIRKGVWPNMSRTGVFERHPPWNFITNILPKEARQKIASMADPEGYISTTLGHALENYTPNWRNASSQAAVVTLDVGQIPRENIHMGGGTNNYHQATDHEWEMTVKRTAGLAAKIFTREASYGGDATEINIEDSNPEGTTIALRSNAVILLPASQERSIRQSLPIGEDTIHRLDRVIWFDDTKFRSVDEALGWLITTPEGKALYQNQMSMQSIPNSGEVKLA